MAMLRHQLGRILNIYWAFSNGMVKIEPFISSRFCRVHCSRPWPRTNWHMPGNHSMLHQHNRSKLSRVLPNGPPTVFSLHWVNNVKPLASLAAPTSTARASTTSSTWSENMDVIVCYNGPRNSATVFVSFTRDHPLC